MAFENYKGSIELGAGLTPAGEGYPLVQACDVQVKADGTNLEDYVGELPTFSFDPDTGTLTITKT